MPVRNGAAFLEEACASVFAQNLRLELLIVDDGSDDDTPALLQRLQPPPHVQLSCFRQQPAGPSAARNRGLRHAGGEVIAFLDHDDALTPGSLQRQLRRVQASGRPSWGQAQFCDVALQPTPRQPLHLIQLSTVLWPARVWRELGPLNEALVYGEDTEFWSRCQDRGIALEMCEDVVMLYRRHPLSLTHDQQAVHRGTLHAMRQRLLERRGEQP